MILDGKSQSLRKLGRFLHHTEESIKGIASMSQSLRKLGRFLHGGYHESVQAYEVSIPS